MNGPGERGRAAVRAPAATGLTLPSLRHVAAVVSHVPGACAELVGADGSARRVSARPGEGELGVDTLRHALVTARLDGRLEALFGAPPALATLHDAPPGTVQVAPGRWSHRCAGHDTEYLVTEADAGDAHAVAYAALATVADRPELHLWRQRDAALATTVVTFEWWARPTGEERAAVAGALDRAAGRLLRGAAAAG